MELFRKKAHIFLVGICFCFSFSPVCAEEVALIGPNLPTRLGGAVRTATFSGYPIPIYTRVGTVTTILLPRMVSKIAAGGNVAVTATGADLSPLAQTAVSGGGEKGDFSVGIVGNILFVATSTAKAYSNLSIMTEGEIYLLTLMEISLAKRVAWDSEITITDPFRYWDLDSPKTLVQMLYDMHVPTDFFLSNIRMVRPDVTDILFDEDRNIAVRVTVRDCLLLPKANRAVWRMRVENVRPQYLTKNTPLKPFTLLPEGINVQNLPWEAVATQEGDNTMLSIGEGIDLFVFTASSLYPSKLDLQFEINGAIFPFSMHLPKEPLVVAQAQVEPRVKQNNEAMKTGNIVGLQRMRMWTTGKYLPDGTYVPPHSLYFFVRN